MGQHTAFIMKCELKADTPQQVIDTLKFMTSPNDEEEFDNFPDHPLFETEEWEYMLDIAGGALWDPNSTLKYFKRSNSYTLKVRTSVKDHEYQIQKFLHWIAPYSRTSGFVGAIRPEYEPLETRILFENGRAYLVQPVENTPGLQELVKAEENNRTETLFNAFGMLNSLLKDDPDSAKMVKQQLILAESLAQNDPKAAAMLDDPRYKSMKERLNKITEYSGESQDEE